MITNWRKNKKNCKICLCKILSNDHIKLFSIGTNESKITFTNNCKYLNRSTYLQIYIDSSVVFFIYLLIFMQFHYYSEIISRFYAQI